MTEIESVKELLQAYRKCELAILSNQSYTIGDQTLTRANLTQVQKERKSLEAELKKLENKSKNRKTRRFIPVDL